MAQRIAGICFFKVDGIQFSLRGAFTVQPLDTDKTGIAGQDGFHGYSEMPVVPYIEGEISDRGTLSLKALQDITDSTVTAELANGKVYILSDAFYAGKEAPIETVDGKIKVRFEGANCSEQLSA